MLPGHRKFAIAIMLMGSMITAHAQTLIPGQAGRPPPGGGDPRSRKPDAPDYRQYEYGKEIYAVKLGCGTCPLGNKPLDEAVAKRFLIDETLGYELSFDEQQAVKTYLRQRFGLPDYGG